jgi:Family of unknown function (DUF6232)
VLSVQALRGASIQVREFAPFSFPPSLVKGTMQQLAACPCQLCSQKIEFETGRFQPGMTAACPHCGMETILFIPPRSQRQSASDGDGDCIFKSGTVTVTGSLLKVGLATFPISAISSFRVITLPEKRSVINLFNWAILVSGIFGILILIGNADNDSSEESAIFGWGLIGIAAFILALRILAGINRKFRFGLIGKPLFGLNIRTSAVEQTIITSPDILIVDAIGDALQQAISKRG